MLHASDRHRLAGWIAGGVLLVVIAGCLKMPLGDPEKSTMDPKFVGTWMKRDDNGSVNLWHVQPWDARTYLVINQTARPDGAGGWERGSMSISKGWLTDVKGATFGTLHVLSEADNETPYAVVRLELATDTLTVRGVKPDVVNEREVKTEPELRKLIEDNLDREELYLEPEKYFKADGPDMETVKAVAALFK